MVSGILDDLSFEDLERAFSRKSEIIEKKVINNLESAEEKVYCSFDNKSLCNESCKHFGTCTRNPNKETIGNESNIGITVNAIHKEKADTEKIKHTRPCEEETDPTVIDRDVPKECEGIIEAGFVFKGEDHNCFRFFNDTIDMDVYYIPRERRLAFHPKYENTFRTKSISWRYTRSSTKSKSTTPTGSRTAPGVNSRIKQMGGGRCP